MNICGWMERKFICELKINLAEASEMMEENPANYWYHRIKLTDPDGKLVF